MIKDGEKHEVRKRNKEERKKVLNCGGVGVR